MEFIENIIKTVESVVDKLTSEYLGWTIAGVLVIIFSTVAIIIASIGKAKKQKEQEQIKFKQTSFESLTPEEINNISNNSANPQEVKEYLTNKVNSTSNQKSKQKTNKTEPQPENEQAVTKTEPQPPVEVIYEPTPVTIPELKIEVKSKNVQDKPKTQQPVKTAPIVSEAEPKKAEPKVEAPQIVTPETPSTLVEQTEQKPKRARKQKATEEVATETQTVTTEKEVKVEVKAEPKTESAPVTANEEKKRNYSGKWKIIQEEDGFYATLIASNGGMLLKTEKYKTLSSVKSGIETIKRNIDGGNFAISVDKYGHYRFKLFNRTNRLICMSEDYSSKSKCESGIESVKRFAQTETIILEDN